jgi:predicted alpha/beta-hydrolase family hydrolase
VAASVIEIETPHGPARAHVHALPDARGVLVLGHGAGGGIAAPDLQASTAVALGLGLAVVLVEQPYRVAGRRSAAPARQLDAAWLAVIAELHSTRHRELMDGLPLIVGGRSSGARVACRTAPDAHAAGVLCLAFPVHPPGKADDPGKSRLPELDAVAVPVLVVQGDRDPFGRPPEGPNRAVVVVAGDHALRNRAAVSAAVEPWLMTLTAASSA